MTFHARGIARNAVPIGAVPSLASMAETARRTPLLKADEETSLFLAWRDGGDAAALDAIVRVHMRLVLGRAARYRNYGLSLEDLAGEGYVGFVDGLRNFDPGRGFRVSTYVTWWVEASLKAYVLANWSLVRVGTGRDQKRLFFRLRALKAKLGLLGEGDLSATALAEIAETLDVAPGIVVDMDRRLSGGGDVSLNVPVGEDGHDWMDLLDDGGPDAETVLAERDEGEKRSLLLREALESLGEREKDIFVSRRLLDVPRRLEELAGKYGVSRERIRQIEGRAFQKLTLRLRDLCFRSHLEPPALAG